MQRPPSPPRPPASWNGAYSWQLIDDAREAIARSREAILQTRRILDSTRSRALPSGAVASGAAETVDRAPRAADQSGLRQDSRDGHGGAGENPGGPREAVALDPVAG